VRVQDSFVFVMREKRKPPVHLLSAQALSRARALRRNETTAEHKLWRLLHDRRLNGAKFRRNHPIPPFFADFCCLGSRLIVEVDGGQHADEIELARDRRRSAYLCSQGFNVVRFWNQEVLSEAERVLEDIYDALVGADSEKEPSP
jgi:2-isopropylmalate synthase